MHSEILVRRSVCIFHIMGMGDRARMRSVAKLNTGIPCCGYAMIHDERTGVEDASISKRRGRVAVCISVIVSVFLFDSMP